MGKILILLNAVGLVLNALVFMIVVHYFEGVEGEVTPASASPQLSRAELERIIDQKNGRISNSLSSLSSKVGKISRDVDRVSRLIDQCNKQILSLRSLRVSSPPVEPVQVPLEEIPVEEIPVEEIPVEPPPVEEPPVEEMPDTPEGENEPLEGAGS